VVPVDVAERIVRNLAEESGPPAEACHARRRIAGASAGSLDSRPHALVEEAGAIDVDQVHGTLDDAVLRQERIVAPGNDVHDGIADAKDVECAHWKLRVRPEGRRLPGFTASTGICK